MTHTLEALAYWKLRAICSEAQRCELVARQARADLTAARQKQADMLAALGLDPQAPTFTLDDEALTIACPEIPSYPY
jgi:hypothetical protein